MRVVRCLGPLSFDAMNGRFISVTSAADEVVFCALRRFLDPLHGHAVLREVDGMLGFKYFDQMSYQETSRNLPHLSWYRRWWIRH